MPYRKETILPPYTAARILRKGGYCELQRDVPLEFAMVMDAIGLEIAKCAVENTKKEKRKIVRARDVLNVLKNGAWKEKFVHGQEACSVCGKPGYVIIKVPKRTQEKEYRYVYCKHGFGKAGQCILGRLVSRTPLASRDGNGLSVPALEKCNEHESACSLLRELSTCMTSKDLKYKRSDVYH